MADEYIRREDAKDALQEKVFHNLTDEFYGAMQVLDELPSADRKGHWIKHGEPPWYVIECSECGAKWQMSGSWDANNFCGNCGAKMDAEGGD